MKIRCDKAELAKGIAIVSKAVPSRTTMPILDCILIDATDHQIKLTGNDMELGICTEVDGRIDEPGMIAIDARFVSEIVKKLPDNEITIATDENLATEITCENAKFQIYGKPGEEFAYLPVVEKENYFTLSQFLLKEMIRQTIFSISNNDLNPMMTGELFEIKDRVLRIVSLDGHRVSIRKMELDGEAEDCKLIIPGKTLLEISRILSGEAEEMVKVFYTKNHVVFEFEKTTVVSRLLDGAFFKVSQILKNDYETRVRIQKREFLNCLERAILLVKEMDKTPIILSVEDEVMKLRIKSQIGSMNENLAIEKEGKDLMIGMNPRYFIDALRVIDEDEVELYMMNARSPLYIRDAEDHYIYFILPVNFNSNL